MSKKSEKKINRFETKMKKDLVKELMSYCSNELIN